MPEYDCSAEKYRPEKIKVLFIAESPPAPKIAGKKSYFYFECNPGSDILFATLVKAVFDIDHKKKTTNKPCLLAKLKAGGFWLMDAVETPINKINGVKTTEKKRMELIDAATPNLRRRLKSLDKDGIIDSKTGIILIKKSVFNVLFPVLSEQGFRVLNTRKIDFPSCYNCQNTIQGIRAALEQMN